MKKILLVTSKYGHNMDANGICVKNVAEYIMSKGHDVYIITEPVVGITDCVGKRNGLYFCPVEAPWFSKQLDSFRLSNASLLGKAVFKLLCMVRRIVVTPFYPNVSFVRARRVYKQAKKIVNEKNIDIVVAAYRPFESIYCALRLKKRFKEKLYVVGYHLDLLMEPSISKPIVADYQVKKASKVINKEIANLDRIIIPQSVDKHICAQNVFRAGFPLYNAERRCSDSTFAFPTDCINITYIGTIGGTNRNVDVVLPLLEQLPLHGGKKAILHIWGKIEDEYSHRRINDAENIVYHGVADNAEAFDLLMKSDFVLNITNAVNYRMVPSKTFQIISTHKPIINIVQNANDASLEYFERVGEYLNIYTWDESAVAKLDDYIKSYSGNTISFDDNLFLESTPEYIAQLILE